MQYQSNRMKVRWVDSLDEGHVTGLSYTGLIRLIRAFGENHFGMTDC